MENKENEKLDEELKKDETTEEVEKQTSETNDSNELSPLENEEKEDSNESEEEEEDLVQKHIEEDEEDAKVLLSLLKENIDLPTKTNKIRAFVEDHLPIDIAYMINDFEDDIDFVFLFKMVPTDVSAEIFSYLEKEQQHKIVSAFTNKQVHELMAELATDDVVDFVEELPSNLVTKVLQAATPEERKELNAFLNYKEDSAGSIMTTDYVEIKENLTCKEAYKHLKKVGPEAETISTTFVVDSSRKLIGALYLDDLIFANDKTPVTEIMNDEFIYVGVDTDQEVVARMMKKYDVTVIPVVNTENRILGIITIDDIMDVIEEEQTEDLQKMAAVTPIEGDYLKTSCFKLAKSRIPWLLFLMLSATLTGLILSIFENALAALPVLTLFIPMLMDTGGNAGGQTTTVVTRALALDQITKKDLFKVMWKEFRIALIVGLCVGVVNFGWIYIELHFGIFDYDPAVNNNNPEWLISLLVAVTSMAVIVMSKTIGAILPLLASWLHLDPAIMAGPLVTTIVDATSLAIYLLLSGLILGAI